MAHTKKGLEPLPGHTAELRRILRHTTRIMSMKNGDRHKQAIEQGASHIYQDVVIRTEKAQDRIVAIAVWGTERLQIEWLNIHEVFKELGLPLESFEELLPRVEAQDGCYALRLRVLIKYICEQTDLYKPRGETKIMLETKASPKA